MVSGRLFMILAFVVSLSALWNTANAQVDPDASPKGSQKIVPPIQESAPRWQIAPGPKKTVDFGTAEVPRSVLDLPPPPATPADQSSRVRPAVYEVTWVEWKLELVSYEGSESKVFRLDDGPALPKGDWYACSWRAHELSNIGDGNRWSLSSMNRRGAVANLYVDAQCKLSVLGQDVDCKRGSLKLNVRRYWIRPIGFTVSEAMSRFNSRSENLNGAGRARRLGGWYPPDTPSDLVCDASDRVSFSGREGNAGLSRPAPPPPSPPAEPAASSYIQPASSGKCDDPGFRWLGWKNSHPSRSIRVVSTVKENSGFTSDTTDVLRPGESKDVACAGGRDVFGRFVYRELYLKSAGFN